MKRIDMEADTQGGMRSLNEATCKRLLGHHNTGRLAFNDGMSIAVVPMNYYFHEHRIIMRTSQSSKLLTLPNSPASFEIDGFDGFGEWGWSVLARGWASEVTHLLDADSVLARSAPVWPMPPGALQHWLVINVTETTGRYFGEPPEFTRYINSEQFVEQVQDPS